MFVVGLMFIDVSCAIIGTLGNVTNHHVHCAALGMPNQALRLAHQLQ